MSHLVLMSDLPLAVRARTAGLGQVSPPSPATYDEIVKAVMAQAAAMPSVPYTPRTVPASQQPSSVCAQSYASRQAQIASLNARAAELNRQLDAWCSAGQAGSRYNALLQQCDPPPPPPGPPGGLYFKGLTYGQPPPPATAPLLAALKSIDEKIAALSAYCEGDPCVSLGVPGTIVAGKCVARGSSSGPALVGAVPARGTVRRRPGPPSQRRASSQSDFSRWVSGGPRPNNVSATERVSSGRLEELSALRCRMPVR